MKIHIRLEIKMRDDGDHRHHERFEMHLCERCRRADDVLIHHKGRDEYLCANCYDELTLTPERRSLPVKGG